MSQMDLFDSLPEELFDTCEEAEAKLREMEGIDNEKTDKQTKVQKLHT